VRGGREYDSDEGSAGAAGPEEEDPDDGNGSVEEEPAPPRSQRRRLVKEKREQLARWDFFQAHQPGEPYEVVVRGEGISSEGGNAAKIGAAIFRIARLLEELVSGDADMRALRFANSVHIEFRPTRTETLRAEAQLEEARKLRAKPEPRKKSDERLMQRTLEDALTNIQVATALAADLIDATAREAPEHAVRLGTSVAQSYKTLANTVARERLTLYVEAPEREEDARLSPNKAERVAEALREVTETTRFIEVVVGTLSIADATQKTFGLAFERGARKPEIFRNRRLIRGSYTPEVEDLIIERGLWGRRVRATIEVERDRVVSTSTIRPPEFRLLDVEQAVT
jgi:hypothetical protein